MKCPFPTCTVSVCGRSKLCTGCRVRKKLPISCLAPIHPHPEMGVRLRLPPAPTLTEIGTVATENASHLSWGVVATPKLSSSALAFEGPAEAGRSPSVGWSRVGSARLEVHPALGWGAAQESCCG